MKFEQYRESIEADITSAHEGSPTVEEAERLAAKFLTAMIVVGEEYRKASLDAKMRKTGVKAIKAAIYIEASTKSEKKPTEAMLAAIVDTDKIVGAEQDAYDRAEVDAAELGNLLSVARESHIYFRGLSKGKYE